MNQAIKQIQTSDEAYLYAYRNRNLSEEEIVYLENTIANCKRGDKHIWADRFITRIIKRASPILEDSLLNDPEIAHKYCEKFEVTNLSKFVNAVSRDSTYAYYFAFAHHY